MGKIYVFYVGKRALGNINNLSQFVPFPVAWVELEGNRIVPLKIRVLIIKKCFQQFFGATLDGLPVTQEQIIKITGFKNF